MTITTYRDELIHEFIKNEESWINRSENMEALKKSRKMKEREEERHKKNVSFFMMVAFVLIVATVILGVLGYTISLLMPKTIGTIENKYDVTYCSYIVSDGDTLHSVRNSIMKSHPKMFEKVNRWNYDSLLLEVNDFENPDKIYPGDEIVYPVF